MTLRPLGDRVLIRPESAPTMTASGLHISEHWKPEQVGEVVAIGRAVHPRRDEVLSLANGMKQAGFSSAACTLIRSLVAPAPPDVQVGDTVIFSWVAGQEVWVNDGAERVLVMPASDILAVIDWEESVA